MLEKYNEIKQVDEFAEELFTEFGENIYFDEF